jgi:ATP-dependent DNA helicase HFM1/MER3
VSLTRRYYAHTRIELALVGVGCHHAGMTMEDRRATENAYKEKKLKVVVATSVLAPFFAVKTC